ncbi:MAG: RDD family protein [Actinomycetota bacterium]
MTSVASAVEQGATAALRYVPVPEPGERLRADMSSWSERGRDTLETGESSATDLALDVATQVAVAVAPRIDLDELVGSVDLESLARTVIAHLDLTAISQAAIDEVDVTAITDAVLAKVDLTAISQAAIDEVDIAAITDAVLAKIDLTAIVQRVIEQLDLTAITERVIDEVELTELIRQSTVTVAGDTVDAIRVGGMNADQFLRHLIDRAFRRKDAVRGADPPPRKPPQEGRSMSRTADATARAMQGRSAGFVTRLSADVFDALLVALTWIGIYLFVGFVPFIAHPLRGFHLPAPAPWFSGLTLCALAIAYLTLSWSGAGRSIGKRIAGLRLEGQADGPIGGARSFARAILYVVLPIGLLWVIVSPRNRSVWDIILSTEVVYDWDLPPARVTETARRN